MTEKPPNWHKTLTSNYIELYKLEQNGDYDRALKMCNKILHNYPEETLAFHCKVVCLIQLSKFDEALHFMKGNAYAKTMYYERAYCLYRCNKPQEALKLIDGLEEDLTPKLIELRAQILYRLDKYLESFEIYRDMAKNASDDYKDERDTNLGASLVYSGHDLINTHLDSIREDTYELCFNKACILVEEGQYAEAEKKLKQCEKLCRESLEDDGLSEEEIQGELAHIKIQLAFIYHKQGRIREAHQLYTANLKLKLDDIALAAVACNNAIIINKDQNVFDSKRKLKVATNELLKHKLTLRQKKFIFLNRATLSYHTNQYEACKKMCDTIDNSWPDMLTHTTMIRVAILVKGEKLEEALKLLEGLDPQTEDDKLKVQLVTVQIWLMLGDRMKACEILENTGLNRYRPGIVGALITLYTAEGKEDVAKNIYKETVEWYRENKKSEGGLTRLWKQAAEFHLRTGQPQVAAHSLEELLKESPNDMRSIGKLVVAYSHFDRPKAIALAKKLFIEDDFFDDLDADAVESAVWLSAKKPANISPAVSSTTSSESLNIVKKKKQRKRKGKLPKNADPKSLPDPERWLPKYERSGYRKKRDRRAKEVIKGSQGSASGQADLYDYSTKMSTDSDQQDSPRVEPSPAPKPSHQSHKKGQKKKNKKR